MKTRLFTTALLLSMLAPAATAQSAPEQQAAIAYRNHRIISIDRDSLPADSMLFYQLMDIYYQDQYRHAQDPQAPYFLFLSKNNSMAMGIGGELNLTGWYQWNGTLDDAAFTPYEIGIPGDPTQDSWLGTSPSGTKLFFTLLGDSKRLGRYMVYIEAKFDGYKGRDFHLKKAYATLGDWTVGYTKSTFADPAAEPSTVEIQGPNSKVGATSVLLRYLHTWKGGWTMAVSAEAPNGDIPDNKYTAACSNYVPNGVAMIQYGFDKKQHIRLAGIVRGLKYRNLVTGTNHRVVGWGAHLSTIFNAHTPLTVMASGIVGRGLSTMVNDLSDDPLDLLPCTDNSGRMQAPLCYGWYGALQYRYRPNLFSTLIFSHQRLSPRADTRTPDMYKYGLYATANLFWDITSRIRVSVEYNGGSRHNYDGTSHWVNRLNVGTRLSF